MLTHSRVLVLSAGQRRVLEVTRTAPPEVTRPVVAPGPAEEPPEASAAPAPNTGAIWGWISLGASVALAGGAGALYAAGARQGNQGHETYSGLGPDDPRSAYRGALDEMDAGRAKLAAGHVLAGASLAAAGVAVYLLVFHEPAARERPEAASWRPRVALRRGVPTLGLEF
jgi:hypothetical protein